MNIIKVFWKFDGKKKRVFSNKGRLVNWWQRNLQLDNGIMGKKAGYSFSRFNEWEVNQIFDIKWTNFLLLWSQMFYLWHIIQWCI